MNYNGIELEPPTGPVAMTHSVALDMIQGQSSTKNMDWFELLGELPYSRLKDDYFQGYVNVCNLFSLSHMDYQVCNGGIEQYFFNRYHENRAAKHEDDVELYGIDRQKGAFMDLVAFGAEIFPERTEDNANLLAAAYAFKNLSFEEDAECYETIYCDEDRYILDEETGEEIENPDYFEPYDEKCYEDVIHGGDGFNDVFYRACDYMEELMELRAQFYCKLFARDVERHANENPELAVQLRSILPAKAFPSPDTSFNEKLRNAKDRTATNISIVPKSPKEPTL